VCDLTAASFDTARQLVSLNELCEQVAAENARLDDVSELLSGPRFQLPPDLYDQTNAWLRKTKEFQAQVEGYNERLAMMPAMATDSTLAPLLAQQEELYRLEENVDHLRGELQIFENLPRDMPDLKLLLDQRRTELRTLKDTHNRLLIDHNRHGS
jgi:hypothetical protein